MTAAVSPNRLALYVGVNVGFVLLVGIGYAIGGSANPRLLHLVLLFALCSTPIVDIDALNGRYSLLAMFMAVYFVSYGVLDLSDLFVGNSRGIGGGVLSTTEEVILTGGVVWVLGYRLAVWLVKARHATSAPRDWSAQATVSVGLILWAIGAYATYVWSVYIIPDTTNEAIKKGLQSVGPAVATAYILGQMMLPLGILLLAYALYAFRNRYLLPIVIAISTLQVALGFVVDIKGLAVLGGVLVIVTCILVTGRIPKAWLAAGVIFVIFGFPIFMAYRTAIHGERGLARTTVVENFGKVLQMTLAAETRVNSGRERAETFWERASLKTSTEMIVEKTGNGVDYQRGHTLTPILATFVPKIVWSDKPDVPTGQLVNKEFHATDSDDIFISPSHLGELYWNFGWAGVIVGMSVMGLACGYVGARCDMAEAATVTRLLVLVLTIKQLITGFEGAIASSYVVWLRSLAAIGLLHMLFARMPRRLRSRRATADLGGSAATRSGDIELFPNLLR